MVTKALYVSLEAKSGKEADLEDFLKSALPLVLEEPQTATWYAIKMGPSSYGIYDTFEDDSGRQAHLNGKVAAALMEHAEELLAKPPQIDQVDILIAK